MRRSPTVHTRFPERPSVGTHFTYNGRKWEADEERLALKGVVEAGNSSSAATLVEE
jgi:hypothetical protein